MEVLLVVFLGLVLVALGLSWVYFIRYRGGVELSRKGAIEEVRKRDLEEREGALGELRSELGISTEAQLQDARRSHEQGLARQAGIVWGKAAEKLAPLFGEWRLRYKPEDLVLVNNTVDYLVLVGRSEDAITEVVFQEVKSGESGRTPRSRRSKSPRETPQEQLQRVIEAKKVRWETWRFNKDTGDLSMDLPPGYQEDIVRLLKEGLSEEEILKRLGGGLERSKDVKC